MTHTTKPSEAVRSRPPEPPPSFACTLNEDLPESAWVGVTGELDISTAPTLMRTLRAAGERARRVLLDLRELTFIDASGIHAIVRASRQFSGLGSRLAVVRGSGAVERMFVLTGAGEQLEMIDLHPAQPTVQALIVLAQKDRAA